MSLIQFVADRVEVVRRDGQLEGHLLKGGQGGTDGRAGHFRLKDLVNPQQIYWSFPPREPPAIPAALEVAWAHGTWMHDKAKLAISTFEGYDGSEIDLDGAAVGISGVKGRIDFRLGDRLVEFKTTSHNLEAAEDVWRLVPQDIEQLLFYAGIWTRESTEHLLIFHNESAAPPVRVFRCSISNLGPIRNILRQRIASFSKALTDNAPDLLKRCRYLGATCPPRAAGLCACDTLPPWNIAPLAQAVGLTRDPAFEAQFGTALAAALTRPRALSPWDLAVPRRAYSRRRSTSAEKPWKPDPREWVYESLGKSKLLPGPLDVLPRTAVDEVLPFRCSVVFVRRRMSVGTTSNERFDPTLIRVWDKEVEPTPQRLRTYAMQLGVCCAVTDSTEGYIVLEKLEDPAWVRAFLFSFRNLHEIKREVRRRLTDLAAALARGDHGDLPECEDWIQERIPCEACLCGEAEADPKETPAETARPDR
jgi:hypothetical protein